MFAMQICRASIRRDPLVVVLEVVLLLMLMLLFLVVLVLSFVVRCCWC